jgi:hypothetical protein
MDFNDCVIGFDVRQRLEEARAAAARHRLAALAARRPRLSVGLATLARRVQDVGRWSSAASAGSKPMTERAWSRSR